MVSMFLKLMEHAKFYVHVVDVHGKNLYASHNFFKRNMASFFVIILVHCKVELIILKRLILTRIKDNFTTK